MKKGGRRYMYNNQEGETRPCYQARGLVKLKKSKNSMAMACVLRQCYQVRSLVKLKKNQKILWL